MQVERREEKRLAIGRPLELMDKELGLGQTGYTRNLSTSGLCARFDFAPTPGEIVDLEVTLDDDRRPLKVSGRVVWSTDDGSGESADVGLAFVEPARSAAIEPDARFNPGERVTLEQRGKTYSALIEKAAADPGGRAGVWRLSLLVEAAQETAQETVVAARFAKALRLGAEAVRQAWVWLRRQADLRAGASGGWT